MFSMEEMLSKKKSERSLFRFLRIRKTEWEQTGCPCQNLKITGKLIVKEYVVS